MTFFWLCALPLAFFAAVLMAWPLLRPAREEGQSLLKLNAQVFRERLAELEKDRADGRVDEETFGGLKTELERNLLLLADASGQAQRRPTHSRWLFLVLVGLVPLLAITFYVLVLFNPALPAWWKVERDMSPAIESILAGREPSAGIGERSPADFIRTLQHRLQSTPDDAKAWFLLGAGYLQLQMVDQSLQAFEHAWRLDPKNLEHAMAYAQTLVVSSNGTLNPQSRQVLGGVLAAYPNHEGALLLLGMGAYRSGDNALAVEALEKLTVLRQSHADPKSEASLKIALMLADARAKQNGVVKPEAVAPAGVEVVVSVDRSLAAKLQPDDTVFVFARAMKGPPMPLAVVRRQARDLPFTVELNDSQSMLPNLKLSTFNEVVISARTSRTGTVQGQAGDLEAVAVPLRQDGKAHRVELVIREERR